MLHTLISYLSRFSRLVLLTFALVVVLILVLFTINSASNDDVVTVDDSVNSSTVVEGDTTTNTSVTYDESTTNDSNAHSLVVINSGSAANTDVSTGNPQSFTANSIDLDSGDTVVVVTTDADSQAALETELENGHVSSTSTTLPNTGIGSTTATVIGLMVLSGVAVSYLRSRKSLSYELLEINR